VILLDARRRAWRRTADALAVAYRYAAHRRDLLAPEGSRALERARYPRTPAEDEYAQRRPDSALVHAAAHADLRRRAEQLAADNAHRWNQLAARTWQRPR
jgi:hypothetical protein